jgi:dihydropyrimidinase
MSAFDLVVHGGTVVAGEAVVRADIGVADGRIAALAERIAGGERRIDASGRLVLPGGIETHCHLAQESGAGVMTADDYDTGSAAALAGGHTCIVPFAAQRRGERLADVMATYRGRAASSRLDYSFHLILSDPSEAVVAELPEVVAGGVTSLKVFLTYQGVKVDDAQFLTVLQAAQAHGALTMVHAESDAMIRAAQAALLAEGKTEPKWHAPARPPAAEAEAIARAIRLAAFAGAPLFIVHVSTDEGAALVAAAASAGAEVWGETCTQYLVLTADDLDRPGMEGAKFVCAPPLRDRATQAVLWRHVAAGTFVCVTSDHAPYRFDETGKFHAGRDIPFTEIANGLPGIGLRLPILFSEGVAAGRIGLAEFARLTAGGPARLFGIERKGAIAPGLDADLAIWDPEAVREVPPGGWHDAMDYTPYEGMRVAGWPETVIARGRVAFESGRVGAQPGDGRFVPRAPFRGRAAGA